MKLRNVPVPKLNDYANSLSNPVTIAAKKTLLSQNFLQLIVEI